MRVASSKQPVWRSTVRAALVVTLIVGFAAACDDDSVGPNKAVALSNVQLKPGTEAGPLAVATFDVQGADSARAWYSTGGGDPVPTEFAPVSNGSARFVVTGLEPATQYQIYIEGRSGPDSTVSQPANFTTDALPEALKNVSLKLSTGSSFTPGYILTETVASDSTLYALAFDSTGKIAWYRRFEGFKQILDLQQQPNGHYTIYLGGSTGWQPVDGEYAEFTVAGDVTHEWKLPDQYFLDGHDLRFTMEDTTVTAAYLFGYDLQPMDMSGHGGGPDSLVAVHKIFKLLPSGEATVLFDAIDRWTLDDWTSNPLNILGDLGHSNSLDFDNDGNLLVSWRNLGAVTKHDINTGEVIWQLGGTKSDFTIAGDPLNGFSGQHFARALPDDHLIVYDNGTNHTPAQSRAVEYVIDADSRTATFVKEFKRPSLTFTSFLGSAQRMPNGHTLVGFGNVSTLTEFDANGSVVTDASKMDGGNGSQFYRAFWVPTLGHR